MKASKNPRTVVRNGKNNLVESRKCVKAGGRSGGSVGVRRSKLWTAGDRFDASRGIPSPSYEGRQPGVGSNRGSSKTAQQAIVISDTHCGCAVGLCTDKGVQLDDGGYYQPSELQRTVYGWWKEFWDKWVPDVTRGKPWHLIHNGDAIDGDHHGAATLITKNLTIQRQIALEVLKEPVARCKASGGKYYHIRGTEAHVGKSAEHEEQLARELGAVPESTGQHARYELWLEVGGKLVHFLHHIGNTSSSSHESSAVNAELTAEFVESARWGEKPPDFIVRSHRHRNIEVRIPTYDGYATAAVTPAWQLKTPFCWKIAGARLAPPQIGGLWICKGDRWIFSQSKVWHLKRSPTEK